jgi:flavin reductase (DIM6/NTAB) family NADH-FMN oxidoreductase RutF
LRIKSEFRFERVVRAGAVAARRDEAFGQSGVCIVTAGLGDDPTGMTVTSATSLSIDPPNHDRLHNRSSSVWQRIQRYRHFCINILADHHNEIAERFAGRGGLRGAARYAGANWKILETGAPALDGALAAID